MLIVDERGRFLGRVNLVDAAALAFVLVLVPLAYGAYLLFRPASPTIDSVTRAEITREERRLAGGSVLAAKLKVRGSGFSPMLRAAIGDTAAMGFVFENPNSADVLVGPVTPGAHDLVLFDGVQEVARAKGAVTIDTPSAMWIRLVGRLLSLDPAVAQTLQATPSSSLSGQDVALLALGPIEPARLRVRMGDSAIDLPVEGRVERDAVILLRCDPQAVIEVPADPCTIGGQSLMAAPPVILTVALPQAALKLAVHDVLPAAAATAAIARVKFVGGPELNAIHVGDRDALLDARAAIVAEVGTRISDRSSHELQVTIRLGVDPSRDGWRYRGRLTVPGAPFTLSTSGYVASGSVEELTLADHPK